MRILWRRSANSHRTQSCIATRDTTATRISSVCSKPVNSISGCDKAPRCSDGKKSEGGEEPESRRGAQRRNACSRTRTKPRTRDGNPARHCSDGQYVMGSEAACKVHRRRCSRGPHAAREPCVSSQRDCARRRPARGIYRRLEVSKSA